MTPDPPSERPPPFITSWSPSKEETEEQHADHVRGWIRELDGREVGLHTGRDGDDGVRVDFLFDHAQPPVALEITSITDSSVQALNSELKTLEGDLDKIDRDEQLGMWIVGLRVGTRIRDIRPNLTAFMRLPAHSGAALYSAHKAPPDLPPEVLASLVKLFQLGLVSALRLDERGHGVSLLPPVSEGRSERGFATLLRFAIVDNVEKLKEVRPRETHLFVTVGLTVSVDPAVTPPPPLPEGVDVLWVYLGYWNAKDEYRLWRTRRDDPRWHMLYHPMGQQPQFYPPE